MDIVTLTKEQARRFILVRQGLAGEYKFVGKEGVLDYIRQVHRTDCCTG